MQNDKTLQQDLQWEPHLRKPPFISRLPGDLKVSDLSAGKVRMSSEVGRSITTLSGFVRLGLVSVHKATLD